ncbi:tyrosine-type recombinase/integrase [Aliarcobacter butzleri]|uniref:tyrosine-type recombinase/integrase n=1 Tax=Aliarcobacter butzleri TaxID=28197 RepID=UPI0021B4BFCB|nr:integrase arm-type DNA-binding domain-containing protein [Aliarcobacter butzleri]MCT7648243.1 integrase arm-type DNA-binding domain-containing protein [Aliarcobacter butzleri]
MANFNLLQDIQVKQAKPKEKSYYLFDGLGLHLEVTPNNSKIWNFRYTFNKKRKSTTFQSYPKVSLAQARKKRDEYNNLLFENIDPIQYYKEQKEIKHIEDKSDFKNIFYEWWNNEKDKSQDTQHQWKKTRFEKDILPFIGDMKIKDIKLQDIVQTLTNKAKTSSETANRLFAYLKSIYSYAMLHGYIERNILIEINKSHFLTTQKVKHIPKITDEENLKDLINAIYNYQGMHSIKNALKFVLHIPLRASNLCNLKWDYINFEDKLLSIPRNLMKVKNNNFDDFKMPLSDEVINILLVQKQLTDYQEWVFLGTNNRTPINVESPNKALKIMGFNDEANNRKITLHGFRGTFRSLIDTLDTNNKFGFDVKERALDHQEDNKVVRAYSH